MAAVQVNMRSVVAAQARTEGAFMFLFVPDHGGAEELGAIGDILEVMEEKWDLLGDDPAWMGPAVSAFGPSFSPLGGIIEVDYVSGPPGSFEGWLEDFADRLRAAGLSGKVSTMPKASSVIPDWYDNIPAGHLGAYAAYDLVDPDQCTAVRRGWNVSDEVTARITDVVEGWAWEDAVSIVRAGGQATVGSNNARVLARAIRAGGGLAKFEYLGRNEIRARKVNVYNSGLAAWAVYQPELSSASIARELVRVLSVLAADTRMGFVQHSVTLAEHWRDSFGRPNTPLSAKLAPYRASLYEAAALWAEWVPDARGLMVLGEAHLAKTSDLSGWQVAELVPGKYLVRDRDLEAWLMPTNGPEPWVLERARSEFGDLIVPPELVKGELDKARQANAAQYL